MLKGDPVVKAYPVGAGISDATLITFPDCQEPRDLRLAWENKNILTGFTEDGSFVMLNSKAITAFVIPKEDAAG